ncbi:MAG: DNA mismatch repair protein MutS, partial [Burkholderiales bacterium]|nr:DNA mismatch repair protein MutS [Burkholderiales bacterium]
IKKEHPGLLLLFRMGDFYECFFEDAEKIHNLLGLTLTSRGTDASGERIPMAGMPYMSLEQHLARLVGMGINVGICEQLGIPGKGLMERKLVRILTPGTLTDEGLLNEKSESCLLAITPSRKGERIALAWLILSSGVFKGLETAAEELGSETARICPSEILVPERFREEMERSTWNPAITFLPDWHFDSTRSEKLLQDQFGTATLEPFGLLEHPELISAAGAVIEYARQTQGSELPHITTIEIETDGENVNLDTATRRNLEISQPLRGGSSDNTLISTVDHCATTMGSRRLRLWLNSPTRSQEEAKKRNETIKAISDKATFLYSFAEVLKGMPDFERIATRIALGTVKPTDLASLRDALPALDRLSVLATEINTELSRNLAQWLLIDKDFHDLLVKALLQYPNSHLRDGDVIAKGYSTELDSLRNLRDHSGTFLTDLEKRERERTGIPNLRVEYNSVQGYFIEISKGQIDKVPENYRRRQTLKNAERYITDELKKFEEEAISAQERSKALEKELFEDLVKKCQPYCTHLLRAAEAVSILDSLYSLANHADANHWVQPVFTIKQKINIKGARHPVVERTIDNYIPNDCLLDMGRRLIIITGPNMGGKSTYMRSVALIVLLAYIGSFVPAESAEIGPVDKILTRIGAADDLAKGLSTFMVEMMESATILRNATEQSLVLMDEVGRGTSTFDGLSLAGAIAEDLAVNRKCMTLFATHYFELTQLEKALSSVVNVHVSAAQSSKNIVFLHEIKEGPASQSYGIAVAKLAGVPRNVIKGAQKLLAKLEERAAKSMEPQLDLFLDGGIDVAPPEEEETETKEEDVLIEELLGLDLESISPRQAWDILGALQDRAKQLKKG